MYVLYSHGEWVSRMQSGLTGISCHSQELESFICSEEVQDQCKKEMLYQKWSERVFAPIQQGLASQMGGSGCRELDRKKRQLFGHYLSYQNRKVRFCLEPH